MPGEPGDQIVINMAEPREENALVESWLNDMLHYDSNAQSGEASQGLALKVGGPGRNRSMFPFNTFAKPCFLS